MIFALLTLFTALSLAAVAGWFSIVGFMAIYAGAPMAALIMGAVTEMAKLVTISWIYRNWEYAGWRLKGPLIYFTVALMVATSIGVFGFLSKGHLEQGAGTIDNSAKIETLTYQINREKSLIADNEKVISQLDATVNSFLGKDRTDRSLSVRKSQAPQRKQLRDESDAAQKRIDAISTEKFALESEIRKMQLDVGPIRYIAELFYGVEENATKNIEAAVRIFTLLIVSTLDPLAVILLVAANHTLLRLRNEKEKTIPSSVSDRSPTETSTTTIKEETGEETYKDTPDFVKAVSSRRQPNVQAPRAKAEEDPVHVPVFPETLELLNEEKNTLAEEDTEGNETLFISDKQHAQTGEVPIHKESLDIIREVLEEAASAAGPVDSETIQEISLEEIRASLKKLPVQTLAIVRQPIPTQVVKHTEIQEPPVPEVISDSVIMRELRGNMPHFIPQKVNEEIVLQPKQKDKYPKALSWLAEFKRS